MSLRQKCPHSELCDLGSVDSDLGSVDTANIMEAAAAAQVAAIAAEIKNLTDRLEVLDEINKIQKAQAQQQQNGKNITKTVDQEWPARAKIIDSIKNLREQMEALQPPELGSPNDSQDFSTVDTEASTDDDGMGEEAGGGARFFLCRFRPTPRIHLLAFLLD